jgi:hypothetical protein
MVLAAIAHRLDAVEGICRFVIGTPRGSGSKYIRDSSIEACGFLAFLPASTAS